MKKKLLAATLIIATLGVLYALSVGPNYPSTIVDNAATGTIAWSNPMNATSSDAIYAQTAPLSGNPGFSHYLEATNFGFSVPVGAMINGIVIEVQKKWDNTSAGATLVDSEVKVVKSNGSIGTVNEATTTQNWPATETYISYGSSSDLWGETWLYSDINNSNFGVVVSAKGTGGGVLGNPTADIDTFRITVYYTAANGTQNLQVKTGKLSILKGKFIIH